MLTLCAVITLQFVRPAKENDEQDVKVPDSVPAEYDHLLTHPPPNKYGAKGSSINGPNEEQEIEIYDALDQVIAPLSALQKRILGLLYSFCLYS